MSLKQAPYVKHMPRYSHSCKHSYNDASINVDIFFKIISIRYDIFENLYRYIHIIAIFLKCPYLGNLSVVTSILTKNKQKTAYFVKGECRDSVNKW